MKFCSWIVLLLFVNVTLSAQVEDGILLSNWKVDTLNSSSQYNNTYNEVWGLSVNGAEYAIIGSTAGTHFVNVTDPLNPVEDFFVQGASYGPHIIHRDFHDFRGYLYIVADEDTGPLKSTMQIVDISKLPESIEVVYDNDDRIRKAHNIYIDTSEARLYAFAVKGGDDPYAPLRIYDIENPLDPIQLGEFRFELDGVSVGHYHDGFVKNHIAYLNAGFDGLVVADLTDPENPILLSHLEGSDYPEAGYNHSGWLSDDGNFYYLGDETWGTDIKVFDVSDPRNIMFVDKFDAGNESEFSIAHNQIAYCNYLFTSYYYDGLQVFDITDPTAVKRVLSFKTSTLSPRNSYEGAWGVFPFLPSGNILVSDMQNGLFVIDNFQDYCRTSGLLDAQQHIATTISPNPSTGIVIMKSPSPITSLKIYDLAGRLLSEQDFPGLLEINTHIEDAGIYFAEIRTIDGPSIQKIIIQE